MSTRSLTDPEVDECAREFARASGCTAVPYCAACRVFAQRAAHGETFWTPHFMAGASAAAKKADEIRARDAVTVVSGRAEVIRGNCVALVWPEGSRGKVDLAPVRLALEAFPEIEDGDVVEVTVRVRKNKEQG